MPERSPRAIRRAVVLLLAAGLLLAGCTAEPTTTDAGEQAPPGPTPSTSTPTAPAPAPTTPTPTPTTTPTPAPQPPVVAPQSPSADRAPGREAVARPSPVVRPLPSPGGSPVPGPVPGVDPELAKTHDDRVEVISEIGGLSYSFSDADGDHFSFSGTDWDSSDDMLTLNVTGTHDGEDSVADWFNSRTLGYAVHTDIDTNSEPDELHYAFCGDLAFTDFGTQVQTCFGQGDSDTLTNNWWMGGPDYYVERPECYIDQNATNAQATSLVACLENHGSSSYTFEVNDGGADANYFSLYSPSQIGELTGSRVDAFVSAHPDLSAGDKAILDTLARELQRADLEVPSSWKVSCDSSCSHSITSGELWAGVHDTTAYDGVLWKNLLDQTSLNNYSINVTAGRNSSSGVANWFIGEVGAGGMIGAGVNDGTTQPGDLHFAFCGDLTPEGGSRTTDMPLCVGQGENFDDGESNNWWLGGADWTPAQMDSETAAEALGLFVPIDRLGILPETDLRMIYDLDAATAIFVVSGNVATGAVVDGVAFVVGLG